MKTRDGLNVFHYAFFTSAFLGDEWSVSCSGHFFNRGKTLRYPLHKLPEGPPSVLFSQYIGLLRVE